MRSSSSVAPSRRWLIVVAEDQPTLRQGLRLTFADDPSVEVVLDRRGTEPQSRLMRSPRNGVNPCHTSKTLCGVT